MTPEITSDEALCDARPEDGEAGLRTSAVSHLSADVDSDAISVIEPRSAWSMVDFRELRARLAVAGRRYVEQHHHWDEQLRLLDHCLDAPKLDTCPHENRPAKAVF